MPRKAFLQLLSNLLLTHSPSGDEEEINSILIPLFNQYCDEIWKDDADNIIGLMRGKGTGKPIRILAHKDEIGAIVKRIDPDGRLVLTGLGASNPWRYGEGPMDVLVENQVLIGILSVGANHISEESKTVYEARFSKPLTWDMVRLDLKLSKDQLSKLGVKIGTRAVVSRTRKGMRQIGDFVAGWGLDDKGAVAIMLQVMEVLKSQGASLPQDVYFVASAGEEIRISGGAYAARTLPGDVLIALEVAPVAEEYDINNSNQPVLIYKDRQSIYHKPTSDSIFRLAERLGFGCQAAVVSAFSSDASYANSYGYTGKAVCLCFPTENTHGYEIANLEAMENTVKLLAAYLTGTSAE